MTTKTITLPDDLAKAAEEAGIFEPDELTKVISIAIAQRSGRSFSDIAKLAHVESSKINEAEKASLVDEAIAFSRNQTKKAQ
jgi:hypothetical protein